MQLSHLRRGLNQQVPSPKKHRSEKGVSIEDVATLMGDTPQVIIRFYAKWVSERQARLSQILQVAFGDQPRAMR
jgi:hypothetical protein